MDTNRLYVHDSRFAMTVIGRLCVRILVPVWYATVVVSGLLLAISGAQPQAKAIGVLILLFIADRLVHMRNADRIIGEATAKTKRINIASYLAPEAFALLEKALDKSTLEKTDVGLEILETSLAIPVIKRIFGRLDIAPVELREKIHELKIRDEQAVGVRAQKLQTSIEEIVYRSFAHAVAVDHANIQLVDIICGTLSKEDDVIKKIKALFGITPEDIANAFVLEDSVGGGGHLFKYLIPTHSSRITPTHHRTMNRAWTARPTPRLDSVSYDITDAAYNGYVGAMIGHDREYTRLLDVLTRPALPHALLIGEAGIGKRTIVSYLAYNIARNMVPAPLSDKRVVELEITKLIAHASTSDGGVARAIQDVVNEILQAGNCILFIPDAHNLAKTEEGFLSAADALTPILEGGAFPVVGAVTPQEYKEYLENRSDITKLFEGIPVEEITVLEAQRYLMHEAVVYERQSGIMISAAAIKQAAYAAQKYFHKNPLPGSASQIIQEAFSTAHRAGSGEIHVHDIIKIAETKSRVPIHEAEASEATALLHLEDTIHARYINQEEAVHAVSDALRTYRSGLSNETGPIASFLFVGPTGVGKTELAKIVSEIQFGTPTALIRIDMGQYKTSADVARLLGDKSSKAPGILTEAVREKPFSLILLDEFEKANPEILDLFLSILSDGQCTDSLGRLIDFKNTIIIATSNAHSDIIVSALKKGEPMTAVGAYIKEKLIDIFKPELLNRFSKIVIFRDLRPKELAQIAGIQMRGVVALLKKQSIELLVSDEALQELARRGYDPVYGARPLQRVIEDQVRSALAQKILAGEVKAGDVVLLTASSGQIQFIKKL